MNSPKKWVVEISCQEDHIENGLRLKGHQHSYGEGPLLISSRGINELTEKVKSSK